MADMLKSETLDQINQVARLTIRLTSGEEISFTLTQSTGLVVSSPLPSIASISLAEFMRDFQYTSDWLTLSAGILGVPWGGMPDMEYRSREAVAPNRRMRIEKGLNTLRVYTYNRTTRMLSTPAAAAFSLTPLELHYWLRCMLTEMSILSQL